MRIKPEGITTWKTATKTKPIKAKPLSCLIGDFSVFSKFLIDTLEGKETLGTANVICIGEGGDAWQQTPQKLLKKYTITDIDPYGWLRCEPKPENEVNFFQVILPNASPMNNDFYIIGHWGTPSPEGPSQYGVGGDYILQNKEDTSDVWIVKESFFRNTYSVKNG